MQKKAIPLVSEKLPSLTESHKQSAFISSSEDLYFFDSKHLFQTFLSSAEIRNKMHIGMAEFRNAPSEL